MRSAVLILALATTPFLPVLVRAQECADAALGAATAPGDLSGYRTLFQQGGVTFYSRIDEATPDSARLVLRNANRVPVEVAFSVQVVAASGPQGGVDAGRRCARIEPGAFLAGVDGVTTFASALGPIRDVRVRNLSLTLLGPSSAPVAEREAAPPASRQAAEPLPELPVTELPITSAAPQASAAEPATDSAQPAGTAPAPAALPAVETAPETGIGALELPTGTRATPILSARRLMGWLSLAIRAAAAVVLVLAGVGLALPILVALYAVLVLTPAALIARLLRRAGPAPRTARSG